MATNFSWRPPSGFELTEEQKGPWNTLEERVALDMKKDIKSKMKFMPPKACFWGDDSPVPILGIDGQRVFAMLPKYPELVSAVHLRQVVVDNLALVENCSRLLGKPERVDIFIDRELY